MQSFMEGIQKAQSLSGVIQGLKLRE